MFKEGNLPGVIRARLPYRAPSGAPGAQALPAEARVSVAGGAGLRQVRESCGPRGRPAPAPSLGSGRDRARPGGLREETRLPGGRAARGPPRPRRCRRTPWPRWARSRSPRSLQCAPGGGRRSGCPAGSSPASTCPPSPGGSGADRFGPSPPPPPRGAAPTAGAAASSTSSGASCPPVPASSCWGVRSRTRSGGGGGEREPRDRPSGRPRARPGGAGPALPAPGRLQGAPRPVRSRPVPSRRVPAPPTLTLPGPSSGSTCSPRPLTWSPRSGLGGKESEGLPGKKGRRRQEEADAERGEKEARGRGKRRRARES